MLFYCPVWASTSNQSPPVEDMLSVPVIGMDGKTEDGSMPYEILKDKLEWLR